MVKGSLSFRLNLLVFLHLNLLPFLIYHTEAFLTYVVIRVCLKLKVKKIAKIKGCLGDSRTFSELLNGIDTAIYLVAAMNRPDKRP